MSIYSAYRRVNDSGYPLDVRIEGYYHSLVPRVPWVTGYGPKNFGYDRFPPAANNRRTKHLVPDVAPPLLAEEEGPPT
jgi:hypothetical protein